MGARILVIDNFDSFVYNLVQYIGELGAEPEVYRDGAISMDDVERINPDGILISPGPGHPSEATTSNELILAWGSRRPILGVCLGLQCMGEVFGGNVVRAPEVVHGKNSLITHDGRGVFEGLSNPLEVTRYHSLIVDRPTVPAELEVTAETSDGLIMGLRHRELPIEEAMSACPIIAKSGVPLRSKWVDRPTSRLSKRMTR
ncbi:MAG TPA: aminodeoxychorismate/anthranilate synthase component II [Microthrixaceae bacterium]|nr:aminodeoxychorismate/anthranilate synthase component II [Microthrixaceae bacterium]